MARDKVKKREFFFKYLCLVRVFYLCQKIRKGRSDNGTTIKGLIITITRYKLVLPLLYNELLGWDVSGTLSSM